jgi:hypothetical protein
VRYVTVFDAAAQPFRNWWFPAGGLIFVGIGLLLVISPPFLPEQFRRRRGLGWFFLVFALLWTGLSGWTVGSDSYHAAKALRSGDYRVVEGRVEHFKPMPKEGHAEETFEVNGVSFAYSDYIVTGGFNNTASHGGPIREGLPVRIAYKDGEILRLEVAR